MTKRPEDYVDLRWTQRVTRQTVMVKLAELLVKFDTNLTFEVRKSSSRAKALVTVSDPRMDFPLLRLAKNKTCVKKFKSDDQEQEGSLYCIRMAIIIEKILKDLDSSTTTTNRELFYQARSELFPPEVAKEMVHDLAIMVNQHPCHFGWLPDVEGEIFVPRGVTLKIKTAPNIYDHMDGKKPSCTNFAGSAHFDIPRLVTSIQVNTNPECEVRAVIVCEHRNLRTNFKRMIDRMGNQGLGGLLVVMTGGCRDQFTAEFLHRLGEASELIDVPFIFISDSNPEALNLFANLKYGSLGLAHLSPSLCCPRLRYGGVTLRDLEDIMEGYADRQLERAADRNTWSEEEREKAIKNWKRAAKKVVKAAKAQKITPPRRSKLTGLKNRGLFENPVDITGKQELERMLEKDSCMFNMQELGKLESAGYMYLIREVVARARNETLAELNVDVQYYSQPRDHLHDSQMSDGHRFGSDERLLPLAITDEAEEEEEAPEALRARVEARARAFINA